MGILSEVGLKILKAIIQVFKKSGGFLYSNQVCIGNDKIYFQNEYISVEFKASILSHRIDGGNVISIYICDLLELIPSMALGFDTEYRNSILNIKCHTSQFGYSINASVVWLNQVYYPRKHGSRVAKIMSSDIGEIKIGYGFLSQYSHPNKRLDYYRIDKNLMLSERVYSTDKYFAYKGKKLGFEVQGCISIPHPVVNIIKYSDKDIIIRDAGDYYELENEYFLMYYIKTQDQIETCKSLFKDSSQSITVDKNELINSLRYIKSHFNPLKAKTKMHIRDLKVNINGVMDISTMDGERSSRIQNFTKNCTRDVSFNTYGNRLLKILSNIKEDKITLKIPEANSGAVIINDTYLLMSWMEWI